MNLSDILGALGQENRNWLQPLPKFVVSNVAEYYYLHDKEYWCLSDFPLPHPPFDDMWVEYRMPKKVYSKEMGAIELSMPGKEVYFGAAVQASEKNSWRLLGRYYHVCSSGSERGKIVAMDNLVGIEMTLDDSGAIVSVKVPPGQSADVTQVYCFHPILMAFSFTNCRNIEIVEVRATEKLQRARMRRNKRPIGPYKIINILPFGKVFKRTDRVVVSNGKLDVAIRHGSYAKYGPKYGRGLLFGKHEGIFWRPGKTIGGKSAEYVVHPGKK